MEQEIVEKPTIADKIAHIVHVLVDSQKSRFQVTGKFVAINFEEHRITGYCAMGALGCEIGYIDMENHSADTSDIMQAYGIGDRLVESEAADLPICPHCNIQEGYSCISDLVIHLNDRHDLTFAGIAGIIDNIDLSLFRDVDTDSLEDDY